MEDLRSVERVRYVINNLLHLVIAKYGVISLVLCISTRLRLVTILSLLMKYLVIFHADPCNKSLIYNLSELLLGILFWRKFRELHILGATRCLLDIFPTVMALETFRQ